LFFFLTEPLSIAALFSLTKSRLGWERALPPGGDRPMGVSRGKCGLEAEIDSR